MQKPQLTTKTKGLFCSDISSDHPVGSDLRLRDVHSSYYQVRNLRGEARDLERKAVSNQVSDFLEAKPWLAVFETCQKILSLQSKDLEVAAWYIESALRIDGLGGFGQACTEVAAMLEKYGTTCFPIMEEEDDEPEDQMLALINLSGQEGHGTLVVPIRSTPLTEPNGEGIVACTWQFLKASEVDRIREEDRKARQLAGLSIKLHEVKQLAANSSRDFLIKLYQDSLGAQLAYKSLVETMDRVTGTKTASTGIEQAIESVISAQRFLTPNIQELCKRQVGAAEPNQPNTEDHRAEQETAGSLTCGMLDSRSSALEQLGKVGDFFREKEPHSPISYGIQQLIRWADLPLPELMAELIQDEKARTSFFQLSGIQVESKAAKKK